MNFAAPYLYAQHGRWLGGESPLRERWHSPLAKGKGVAARRGPEEAGGKIATRGIRTRCEAVRPDEWANDHEVRAIKGQSGKSGWGARKVSVLIWGDLPPSQRTGNPPCERRLRRQGSAEAIVPTPVMGGEGPNVRSGWT